jgi:hypothetical protein
MAQLAKAPQEGKLYAPNRKGIHFRLVSTAEHLDNSNNPAMQTLFGNFAVVSGFLT